MWSGRLLLLTWFHHTSSSAMHKESAGISAQRSCVTPAPWSSLPQDGSDDILFASHWRRCEAQMRGMRIRDFSSNAWPPPDTYTQTHIMNYYPRAAGVLSRPGHMGSSQYCLSGFPKTTPDCCWLCPLKPHGGSPSSKKDLVVWFFGLSSGSEGPKPSRANLASVCTPLGHTQSISRCCSTCAQFKAWLCLWVMEPKTCTQVWVLGSILEAWQRGNDSTIWRLLLEAQFCHQ